MAEAGFGRVGEEVVGDLGQEGEGGEVGFGDGPLRLGWRGGGGGGGGGRWCEGGGDVGAELGQEALDVRDVI